MGDRLTPDEIEVGLAAIENAIKNDVVARADDFQRSRVEYSRGMVLDRELAAAVERDTIGKTALRLWQQLRAKAGEL